MQYSDESFFKIASYEQIVRAEAIVQKIQWDSIILDEGQRLKNCESKTSRIFQLLQSRIARAHRMGQNRPVHVYILISEGTIEERLLATLAATSELASASLDFDSDISEVRLAGDVEELKRRLESLQGDKPIEPTDQSQ